MGMLDRFNKEKENVPKSSVTKKTADDQKSVKKTTKKTVAKKTETKVEKKAVRMISKKATSTIISPIVSEKTAQLSDANILTFKVAPGANRIEVRNAFRELYKVTPIRVNMINVRGKAVTFGRMSGKRQDYKKALISLAKGTKVDIFEGI